VGSGPAGPPISFGRLGDSVVGTSGGVAGGGGLSAGLRNTFMRT
jgi:hypothetical protein